MKQFKKVRTDDDLEIQLYKSNVITPKAILFLVHGMGEHAMRYAHVAEYFKNVNILFQAEVWLKYKKKYLLHQINNVVDLLV